MRSNLISSLRGCNCLSSQSAGGLASLCNRSCQTCLVFCRAVAFLKDLKRK